MTLSERIRIHKVKVFNFIGGVVVGADILAIPVRNSDIDVNDIGGTFYNGKINVAQQSEVF